MFNSHTVVLYHKGIPGAWTVIPQQGGPLWCLHAHLVPPRKYTLCGLPNAQGYIGVIPTSRLPTAYPNRICVIGSFILRIHGDSKVPGQQQHASM